MRAVLRHIILSSIFLFTVTRGFSQVKVQDPIFEDYLKNRDAQLFLPNGDLDTNYSIVNFNGTLDLTNSGVSAVEEIKFLRRIDTLLLSKNNLSELKFFEQPNKVRSVELLDLSFNNFSVLPEVYRNPALKKLDVSYNQLTTLPREFNWIKDSLEVLILVDNYIDSLQDMSQLVNLTEVDLRGNSLTFEDIDPMTTYVGFEANWKIQPQRNIPWNQNVSLKENESYTLVFPIDTNLTNITYHWFKDGELITETNDWKLELQKVSTNDAGSYHVELSSSNTSLSSVRLSSDPLDLEVEACFDLGGFSIDVLEQKCSAATISFQGTAGAGVHHQLKEKSSYEVITLFEGEQEVGIGNYDLMLTDSLNCSFLESDRFSLTQPSSCDNVFTPDGNGDHDTFYIEREGSVIVYNSQGTQVRSLIGPTHWDGKDDRGVLVKPDYYMLFYSEDEHDYVTVQY